MLKCIEKDSVYVPDEFEIVRNEDRSAWICVYLKSSPIIYEGSLREVSIDTELRKYICLSGYYKYVLKKNGKPREPYMENLASNNHEKVILYYDDIARIEKRDTN